MKRLLLTLLCLTLTTHCLAAEAWRGRRLSDVLDELRAAGLPLLYSSQIVPNDLIIDTEPNAALQLERLRQALASVGLKLQALQPAELGYAIVRDSSNRAVQPDAETIKVADSTANSLEEVTIFASRYNLSRDQDTRATTLSQANLARTAGIEQDVLRSVQNLPGAANNTLSAVSHVRGGYEDENLVQFDGVELYRPVHLKDFQGLFGMLDPEWAQSIDYYSGAFPVRYGNYNASVLDITPRQTDDNQYAVSASLLYSRLFGSGAYQQNQGHWLLGYRRSNVSEVLRHSEKQIGEPEFEDFLLHNQYQFNQTELRMGFLRLNDDLQLQTNPIDNISQEQAQVNDHDTYAWLGWRQDWSDALNSNTQLNYAALRSARTANVDHIGINDGSLYDQHDALQWTLTSDLQWQIDSALLASGIDMRHVSTDYNHDSQVNFYAPLAATFAQPDQVVRHYVAQLHSNDYHAYLNWQQQWHDIRTELGVRYDRYPYLNQAAYLSPRLNAQWQVNNDTSIKASAGRYVQAQPLYGLSYGLDTNDQPQFYRPEVAQQYILGLNQRLTDQVQLRVEAYTKLGNHLRPRSENLLSIITLASELAIDRYAINADRSRAQGLEVALTSAQQQPLTWWLNYSWSHVEDRIGGRYYRRSWDQPHALSIGGAWSHTRWLLSGSTRWHSGWAYTPLLLSADHSSASLGERNSARYASYFAIDLRAQYTLPMRDSQLQTFLELRNATDHDNSCCRDVDIDNNQINIETIGALRLIPIAGVTWRF